MKSTFPLGLYAICTSTGVYADRRAQLYALEQATNKERIQKQKGDRHQRGSIDNNDKIVIKRYTQATALGKSL